MTTSALAFVAVSLVAGHLSVVARSRKHALTRLLEFNRDTLLDRNAGADGIRALVAQVAERFRLQYVAIGLATQRGLERHETWTRVLPTLPKLDELQRLAQSNAAIRDGIVKVASDPRCPVWIVALRRGTEPIGLLAVGGRRLDAATLRVLASVVALAIERIHLLDQYERAELPRRQIERVAIGQRALNG